MYVGYEKKSGFMVIIEPKPTFYGSAKNLASEILCSILPTHVKGLIDTEVDVIVRFHHYIIYKTQTCIIIYNTL